MWRDKIFNSAAAMERWIEKNDHRFQWEQIFVNNAYGVSYRPLRQVY